MSNTPTVKKIQEKMRNLGLKGVSKVSSKNKGAYITMIKKRENEARPRSSSLKGKPLSSTETQAYMSHAMKKQKIDEGRQLAKQKKRAASKLAKDRRKALDQMYSKDELFEGIKHHQGSKKAWYGFNKKMTKAKMIDMVVKEGMTIRTENLPEKQQRKIPRQHTIKESFARLEKKSKKEKPVKKKRGWFGSKEAHAKAAKLGWERRMDKLEPASDSEIKKVQQKRTKRARLMDSRSTSRKVLKKGDRKTRYWAKHPGRYDIEGVDTKFSSSNPGKFQLRGKKYDRDKVLDSTMKFIKSKNAKQLYDVEVKKLMSRVKKPTPKEVKAYGNMILDQHERQLQEARKQAVTNVLNKGFGKSIPGGMNHNPHAPERLEDVDLMVVDKSLEQIRKNRMSTVHRNYSESKKK